MSAHGLRQAGGTLKPVRSEEIESLRGRMPPSGMISEGERQVEGLSPEGDAARFESLLAESFS